MIALRRWVRFPHAGATRFLRKREIKPKEEGKVLRADEAQVGADEDLEPEDELCEHGYPEGSGCQECEFWEYVDYLYDHYKDK